MRYSREALASIDTCIDELRNASTIVQTKMLPGSTGHGETPSVCASRHFHIKAATGPLIARFVDAVADLMELGVYSTASKYRIGAEERNFIEEAIRQLFGDAAHKGWRQTEADAHHLEAAE